AAGYDHPDFIYAFSPKPFLMLSAIRDFFSIEGARATYSEASRVYDSLGVAAKFGKFEADDGHGYTQPRREAAYRWFTKWLKGAEDITPESPVRLLSETEANCTPTGQIATSLKGHTVHSLNLARWKELRKPGSLEDVKRLTGFQARLDGVKARSYGTLAVAPGIVAEKYLIEPEKGIVLPALLYRGEGGSKKDAVILAHGRGKVAVRAEALALAKAGKVVLAVDLRGMGETSNGHRERSGDWSRYLGDYESAQIAFLLNKPLVGMRAEDVSAAVTFLAGRADVDAAKIRVHAFEMAAVPALHAMAMDTRIAALTVERMVQSYESIIRGRIHRGQTENIVVGALRHYDLPDLINWSSPRKVTVVDPLNPLGQLVTP
ncbi:MAG: alpha/beta hydrolase, partial [Bryobacterales bacterium]|nr:alpha/beta hydrolase [Bryobacterales bacterium]